METLLKISIIVTVITVLWRIIFDDSDKGSQHDWNGFLPMIGFGLLVLISVCLWLIVLCSWLVTFFIGLITA